MRIAFLLLLIPTLAFAGSDELLCSSKDGSLLLKGTLWGRFASLSKLKKSTGQKIDVTSVEDMGTADIAFSPGNGAAETFIASAKKALLSPDTKDWYASKYVVGATEKPIYAVNESESDGRDYGEQEFTQKVRLYEIGLEPYSQKKVITVKTTDYELDCQYSYASAR